MKTKATQNAQTLITLIVSITLLSIIATKLTTTSASWQLPVSAMVGLSIAVLSFFRQDLAAIATILAMLLSPEIKVASLGPTRDIVIRYEDVIVVFFFASWLFKMAYFKNLRLVRVTALDIPIALYIMSGMMSTWWGVANGQVQVVKSVFYFIKYIEYFMIYFMFSNIIYTEEQLKKFLSAFYMAALISSTYGLYQMATGVYRISAPFESVGQPNTYGGYLIIISGAVIVSALKAPNWRIGIVNLIGSAILTTLLIGTLSRSSYLAYAVMLLFVLWFVKPIQKFALLSALAVLLAASPYIISKNVKDRVMAPFKNYSQNAAAGAGTSSSAGIGIGGLQFNEYDSSYQKVKSALNIIAYWKKSPIIGYGVTSVGLVDTQYPLILGEMGLLGMFAFLWIIFKSFQQASYAREMLEAFPEEEAWQWKALAIGYTCSLAGLIVHGIGANTFIIVRIMEPFWFLTAVITSIPKVMYNKSLEQREAAEEEKAAPKPWQTYPARIG